MKELKEKILNSTIQEVSRIFTQLKNDGYNLEEIHKLIFG